MIDHHDDNAGVSVAKPSSAARSPSTVYCTTAVQYTVNSDTVMCVLCSITSADDAVLLIQKRPNPNGQ